MREEAEVSIADRRGRRLGGQCKPGLVVPERELFNITLQLLLRFNHHPPLPHISCHHDRIPPPRPDEGPWHSAFVCNNGSAVAALLHVCSRLARSIHLL
jgi:hypothetical protein